MTETIRVSKIEAASRQLKEKDVEGSIDFAPRSTELFLMFGVLGLALGREEPGAIERAFLLWVGFNRPGFFSEKGRKRYLDSISTQAVDEIRSMPKRLFLDAFMEGAKSISGQPIT